MIRLLAFALFRLRSGPFEGPATEEPPALPEDGYSNAVTQRWRKDRSRASSSMPYLTVLLCRSPVQSSETTIEFAGFSGRYLTPTAFREEMSGGKMS